MPLRFLLVCGALAALGCAPMQPFHCEDNRACALENGTQGICEVNGACSFPDSSCPGTHRRMTAGPEAADCVPAGQRCIVGLALGAAHACAVRDDGRVLCWGANVAGQAGASIDHAIVSAPTVVDGLPTGATAIAAGTTQTCALFGDGSVSCWGSQDEGVTVARPSPVLGSSGAFVARALAVGDTHACAIGPSGVSCWGDNSRGQCGQEPALDGGVPWLARALPVVGSALLSATSLGAGAERSCGVSGDGHVYCFGSNQSGGLGSPLAPAAYAASPVPVEGLADVAGLAVGAEHACAVRSDHSLWCWGYGGVGSLGSGVLVDAPRPVQVGRASRAVAGSASDVTCTLDADGWAMACWGRNESGQTGTGFETPLVPSPTRAALTTVDLLALGGDFGCATTQDGTLWCWGKNDQGQLGSGSAGGVAHVPRRVEFPCYR